VPEDTLAKAVSVQSSPSSPDTLLAEAPQDYHGFHALARFFHALQCADSQVRIAYFGDSSIEGDLVSQSLRDTFQKRFGGAGVGFVSILPAVPHFRQTVLQEDSGNWFSYQVGIKNAKKLTPGISGKAFAVAEGWAGFKASSRYPGVGGFPLARLFYGTSPAVDSLPAVARILRSSDTIVYPLAAQKRVNVLRVPGRAFKSLRIGFSLPEDMPVYGLSFESEAGVLVDNYSIRGSDGLGLLQIPTSVLEEFQQAMGYDLIILQFGMNAITAGMKHYSWYTQRMVDIMAHLQTAMPEADILIVGVQDKAAKREDGTMATDSAIARITHAQRNAAYHFGAAFFSMYEAMGGEGAMLDWVENRGWGSRDYTHFNARGAEEASHLLMDFLMNGFSEYNRASMAVNH
jgi:lysophospholipase L1-like esterase